MCGPIPLYSHSGVARNKCLARQPIVHRLPTLSVGCNLDCFLEKRFDGAERILHDRQMNFFCCRPECIKLSRGNKPYKGTRHEFGTLSLYQGTQEPDTQVFPGPGNSRRRRNQFTSNRRPAAGAGRCAEREDWPGRGLAHPAKRFP